MQELSIIQRTYDLIKWYVPILNKLPRDHKYGLGSRIIDHLYILLEKLLEAKYSRNKIEKLHKINLDLDILRYQSQLLFDFNLLTVDRYHYLQELLSTIGKELGGWIKSQNK